MNKDLSDAKNKSANELIVIPDECGDTIWNAVLQQEVKECDVKTVPENTYLLLNRINAASRKLSGSDTTEVE